MKKLLALACIALSLAGRASATPYSDVNPADVWLIPVINPSYTGEFTLAGYNPSIEEIVSATVTFTLWDSVLLGGKESYLITLTDMSFSGGKFAGLLTFGDGLSGTALFDLSSDGSLFYTVTATTGEFWLKEASLVAESAPLSQNSVPDNGATLALTGAALLGLVAIRRKSRA